MINQKEFDKWLTNIIKNFSYKAKAFCFNIYELDAIGSYSIEFTAFDKFDEYDANWNVDGEEIYASRDDGDEFQFTCLEGWQYSMHYVKEAITNYLHNDNNKCYSVILNSSKVVAYGFIDGDTEYILINQ